MTDPIVPIISWRRMFVLLRVNFIRNWLTKIRMFYFVKIKKSLRIWDGERVNHAVINGSEQALEYNLSGLHDLDGERGLRIIRPLSVVETLRPLSKAHIVSGGFGIDYVCDASVLTIGPRTEGEIFALAGYGFDIRKIRGLDLYSYSPFIDVGDMHRMPYSDNQFDVVICACVLVYSRDPKSACDEMARVAKDGGLICIMQDTIPSAGQHHVDKMGKATITCQDYLDLFGDKVKRVFFRHELPERLHDVLPGDGSNYTMSVIFQLQK